MIYMEKDFLQEFGGISYGMHNEGRVRGKILEFHGDGQEVEINIDNFQQNKLAILEDIMLQCTWSIINSIAFRIERDIILDKIKELKGAPGRYELVNCKTGFYSDS